MMRMVSPSSAISFFQPSGSSSAKPSSMDTMGYLATQSLYSSTRSSLDMTLGSSARQKEYCPTASVWPVSSRKATDSSLAAGSSANATSTPGTNPHSSIACTATFRARSSGMGSSACLV